MHIIEVVIETPKGSAQKFYYYFVRHFFKLRKILPSGMTFPYDFGFIPETQGADGDPLDVIVISEFDSFPGCVIDCRLIGAITAEQSAKPGKSKLIRNDRFLAIPECSNIFSKIESIDDLPKKSLKELQQFFVDYNKQEEKEFKLLELIGPREAAKVIKSGETGN